MKNSWTTPLFISISIILPLGALPGMELQPGDSIERVKEVLGRPNGVISLKNKQVLFFDRGEVTLVDGKATQLDILSEEEAAAELEKKKQKREKAAQLVERVDESVLGGLTMRIGDEKFDTTVAMRLRQIGEAMQQRASQEIHGGKSYVEFG